MQVFDRGDTDRRHVKPHVLLRLGNFDQGPAAGSAKLAGSLDAAIGPFDGFDGQGRLRSLGLKRKPSEQPDWLRDSTFSHLKRVQGDCAKLIGVSVRRAAFVESDRPVPMFRKLAIIKPFDLFAEEFLFEG